MTDHNKPTPAGLDSNQAAPTAGRRDFLKGVASASAAGVALVQQAQAATPAGPANSKLSDVDAKAVESGRLIPRPGSDFMVDVIKSLNVEYVAANPGSSFRSLHESVVNYGGNKSPELITCLHEESSVAIAHGYAKAAGKPMAVMAHGSVGFQHAAMAVYNAWCDRVPVIMFGGNGIDADKRRPGTEWSHSVQDPALLLRDYVKWDDAPGSLQHFAESTVRAYRVATTGQMGPVVIMADIDLQEDAIHGKPPTIPKLRPTLPLQGDTGALQEAAQLLLNAKNPVIMADRAARNQDGVKALVKLAESLQAPVIDLGGRMNFPNTHHLCLSDMKRALVRDADVILMLEVYDPWGQVNGLSDPFKTVRPEAKADVKIITIGMNDVSIRSNYQDFQRFLSVEMAIPGEAQASMPVLTEYILKNATAAQKASFEARREQMKKRWDQQLKEAKEGAALGWDASPISTARLAMETFEVIKNEPWCLAVSDRIAWARKLWPTTQYHQMLGGSGGQGVGYGLPASVGAALANKSLGRMTVTFQPDGDLLYAPGALWTAAHHKIPLLMVMHNNGGYYQEVMHLQRMASLHNRRTDQAWIGNSLRNPDIDFAKIAQGMGVWAEGPIKDPSQLKGALQRALAEVKQGRPALLDVVCQAR
ncbi:MAG: twin-arginine translocation signal domain-containing protein [Betaproteobacteria bacterium]|jgi:thiamine pyrophosphate-dependent acetolactate synthase large subunit-like protein|nr:twin-arginine translocation signal domain-containing protein [Betaproteobacteria bacterium]